jgi:hypothetical protein
MRVTFQTEGGIAYMPGLAKPVEIDTNVMSAEDADALCNLIDEADFFELPPVASVLSKGAADHQTYTITIDDGERHHTVQLTEPVPEELRPLVSKLRATAKAMRAAARSRKEPKNKSEEPRTKN